MTIAKEYKRERWRRLRTRKLTMNPWCECPECAGASSPRVAAVVDHIQPVNHGGSMWAWDNLRSMAWSCHSRKTRVVDMNGAALRIRGADPDTGRPLDSSHPWNAA